MSVYETTINNPKKQLEFYKQLSEQLQRENQQLKIQISAREEEYRKLEDNWNKLKESLRFIYDFDYGAISDCLDKMQKLERGVSNNK